MKDRMMDLLKRGVPVCFTHNDTPFRGRIVDPNQGQFLIVEDMASKRRIRVFRDEVKVLYLPNDYIRFMYKDHRREGMITGVSGEIYHIEDSDGQRYSIEYPQIISRISEPKHPGISDFCCRHPEKADALHSLLTELYENATEQQKGPIKALLRPITFSLLKCQKTT